MKRNPFAQQANDEPITLASEATLPPAAPLNYDYSLISEQDRQTVQVAAAQIKLQFRRAQNSILEIGKQLAMVKSKLDHGQWGDWLTAEFSLTDRSAQRYMAAFETFGNKPDANLLTSSALMLLSGDTTPEPAREEAIQQAKATGKSPTKSEVKEIITKHKPPTITVVTLSESETLAAIRKLFTTMNRTMQLMWLTNRPTTDGTEKCHTEQQRFDSQVYKRVRKQLLEELQQPAQKPAAPRSPAPASITPAPSTTPQIAPIASATQSDLPVTDEQPTDVKALINHYTESVRLLPLTKQAIKDPAFQWSYDRLQRDLRILVQHLNQL